MENEVLVTIISSLIVAASFVACALPFLNRTEKKERYLEIIEKRRKDLFAAARDVQHAPKSDTSARESMAGFYKVQRLAGQMGENIRLKMLQAGIRSTSAPIKFMIA